MSFRSIEALVIRGMFSLAAGLTLSACHTGAVVAASTDAPTPAALVPAAQSEGAAGGQPEAADVPAMDPVKLAAMIAQLDDDRFAVRETAQQRLAASGVAALDQVSSAAASGSLESTTRAVNILLQWAQSDDSRLSLGALERIAQLKNRPAEAAMAIDRLADVREAAAVKAIVSLGGHVEYDRGLPAVGQAAGPVHVKIGPQWKGGVDGLTHIQDIRHAAILSFHSAPIEEVSTEHLADLPKLQRIEFYGTRVSDEALAALKKTVPQVEVRGGARLGIAGLPNGNILVGGQNAKAAGAIVQMVQPASAAAKAGLQAGDVIMEFKGVQVENFVHLTEEIAKCQPGDSVELKVLRQTPQQPLPQPVAVTVTFDRWGEEIAQSDEQNGPLPNVLEPFGNPGMGVPRGIIINRR